MPLKTSCRSDTIPHASQISRKLTKTKYHLQAQVNMVKSKVLSSPPPNDKKDKKKKTNNNPSLKKVTKKKPNKLILDENQPQNLETGKLTLHWWQCETQELTDKESQPQD